jgi:hypothetical protein
MHAKSPALRIAAALLLLLSLPWWIAAQDVDGSPGDEAVRIWGSVVDRVTGGPIPSALITILPFGSEGEPFWSGQSDAEGSFLTDLMPPGSYEMEVEVLPFSKLTHLLLLTRGGRVDVRVEMVTVDYELPPIVVVATRLTKLESGGFYARREAGRGTFLTRADIAERSPSRLSELFRTIPGARIIQGQFGQGDAIRLRGGCTPVYVLDGVVLSGPVVLDELFPVAGVEGIEVYHGAAAPMEYVGSTSCGVVMLWSRDPTTGTGSPFTWMRLITAVGFGALIALLAAG